MAGSLTDYLTKMSELMEGMHKLNSTTLEGWRFRSLEAFVLGVGRECTPSPLPRGVGKGRFKQCFSDAYKLASRKPERYVYCEGFAHSGIIPVLHAWCLDLKRDNVVVDRTWYDNRGQEYFGVPFNIDYVNTVLVRTEVYGVLGSLWKIDDERNPLIIEPSVYLHSSHQGGK